MASNQQQIIEQAKFTYSPLGKLLKNKQKQLITKTKKQIKQIKAIQDNKEQIVSINNDDDYKNKLLFSREREIF